LQVWLNRPEDLRRTEISYQNIGVEKSTGGSKKGYGHIRGKVNDAGINDFINQQKDDYPIQTICA